MAQSEHSRLPRGATPGLEVNMFVSHLGEGRNKEVETYAGHHILFFMKDEEVGKIAEGQNCARQMGTRSS